MKIDRVHIKNFRSIKDITLAFDNNCQILLGKNEAGKSNILRAIAAVFGQYVVSSKDKRKRVDNEKIADEDYFVRCIIKLDEADFKDIEGRFKAKYKETKLLAFENGTTLYEYIKTAFKELLISIKIDGEEKPLFTYWSYDKEKFKLVSNISFSNNSFGVNDTTNLLLLSALETMVFTLVKECYSKKSYKCHFWEYSKDYLLPNSINIDDFKSNPTENKSVENLFILRNCLKIISIKY